MNIPMVLILLLHPLHPKIKDNKREMETGRKLEERDESPTVLTVAKLPGLPGPLIEAHCCTLY
jgi:hypothetical protein